MIDCRAQRRKNFYRLFISLNSMLSPLALEFPLPVSQRGSPRRTTKFLCRKANEKKGLRKISRLLTSAYVRAFSARERILLFTRGGPKPALALPALQSPPPRCANLRLPLLPIRCSIRTICYRGAVQDLSSETCFLPKSGRQHTYMPHLLISNRGGGVGRQVP